MNDSVVAPAPGYSSGPGWSDAALDTVNKHFDARLALTPDRQFLDCMGENYTYHRLHTESMELAHGLQALGVKKGHTVVYMLDNGAVPIVLMFALFRLGAISVGINTALKGEFLRHQITDAGAAIVVAEADYAERVLAIEDKLPEVSHLFVVGQMPQATAKRLPVASFSAIAIAGKTDPIDVEVRPSDLALLVYTGGTTGPSKGCMVSHNYACSLARQVLAMGDRNENDVIWTPLPNFHFNLIASTIIAMLMLGGKAAIYTKFSLSNFWPEIERTGATRATLMGAMLPLLAQAPDTEVSKRCFGQLKTITGVPMSPELAQTLTDRFGCQLSQGGGGGFGLTECSLITSSSMDVKLAPNSCGKRNDLFDVRIFDDDDRELAPGEAGEIVVRPLKPHVMFEGFWRKPVETFALWRNGWFHTGDMGKFDEDGNLFFVDRKKDYMRRRGENIATFEMDNCFRTHPAIEDVAVHAVPSELSEDDVKVTYTLRAGETLSNEELCHWSIENIPYYAVPRYYEQRAQVPRSPLGRIMKYELRADGVTAATFDMEKAGIKFTKR
jgi:carnitine-CoA ligase